MATLDRKGNQFANLVLDARCEATKARDALNRARDGLPGSLDRAGEVHYTLDQLAKAEKWISQMRACILGMASLADTVQTGG